MRSCAACPVALLIIECVADFVQSGNLDASLDPVAKSLVTQSIYRVFHETSD